MSQSLIYALEKLREAIIQHANDVYQRDMFLVNQIDEVLKLLGVKITRPTVTTSTTTTVPTTTTTYTAQPQITTVNVDLTPLLNELKEIKDSIQKLSNEGIKFQTFKRMSAIRLEGSKGITRNGQIYELREPADAIYIIPTVETVFNINSPDLGDQIPALYANGSFYATIKTHYIAYRASSAVPDSVLPAPLYLYAFYYE